MPNKDLQTIRKEAPTPIIPATKHFRTLPPTLGVYLINITEIPLKSGVATNAVLFAPQRAVLAYYHLSTRNALHICSAYDGKSSYRFKEAFCWCSTDKIQDTTRAIFEKATTIQLLWVACFLSNAWWRFCDLFIGNCHLQRLILYWEMIQTSITKTSAKQKGAGSKNSSHHQPHNARTCSRKGKLI